MQKVEMTEVASNTAQKPNSIKYYNNSMSGMSGRDRPDAFLLLGTEKNNQRSKKIELYILEI